MIFVKKLIRSQMQAKKNVYIIPTKNGFRYLITNFALFLIALTYSNNLSLILCFIMITYFIFTMIEEHQKIAILKELKTFETNHFHADKNGFITLYFSNNIDINLESIKLELQTKDKIQAHLYKQGQNFLQFKIINPKRGSFKGNKFKLYISSHKSFFYIWRYLDYAFKFYVYPAPIKYSFNSQKEIDTNNDTTNSYEYKEHIKYIPGHSYKKIDWKKYALTDQLFWKKYESGTSKIKEIEYNKIEGNTEEKLSYCTYLILKAENDKDQWNLIIPDKNGTLIKKQNLYSALEFLSDY